jgi:hypothetical protein
MHDGPEDFDWTGGILRQRVGYPGPSREFRGAVGEHLWCRIGAGERSHYIGKRLRQ